MNAPNVGICCVLLALGVVFHFMTKLGELEAMGAPMTPWQYWSKNPYTSATVVIGAYLSLAFMWSVNEMTYSASLLLGIAANSAGDKLRAQASMMEDTGMGAITVQRKVFLKDPVAR